MRTRPELACVLFVLSCTAVRDDAKPKASGKPEVALNDPDALKDPPAALRWSVARSFPSDTRPGVEFGECIWASPLVYQRGDEAEILVAVGEEVVALNAASGERLWSVTMPASDTQMGMIVATPALSGDLLVVTYHTTDRVSTPRSVVTARRAHWLAVIDLKSRALAEDFAPLELRGSAAGNDDAQVTFKPAYALGRSAVVIAGGSDARLGRAYVTFGNARDIQPWHGFAFEVDLDAWRAGSEPMSGFLVTTPENDCGEAGKSGSKTRQCGGGLWAPSGPLIVPGANDDGYELIFAPGNGMLDLNRSDYANTLMRVKPGLTFDPGCDPVACQSFDSDEPGEACIQSCDRLFVPRMPAGELYPAPEDESCEGMTMLECWQQRDYIGGSTPVMIEVSGIRALLYPTKDGSAYLVDMDHMGKMHDRQQLVAICGSTASPCAMSWAGMIVTQPELVELDGETLALVPTFMADGEHPGGVVALAVRAVEEDGETRLVLERKWEAPSFDDDAALKRFRVHPSRLAVGEHSPGENEAREKLGWIVEPNKGKLGRLLAIRLTDGAIVVDTELRGRGQRFTRPLILDDHIYTPSCDSGEGPSFLEAHVLSPKP